MLTDLMATLFEIVLVVWLAVTLVRRPAVHRPSASRIVLFVLLIAAIAIGTTVALAQPSSMGGG